MPLPELSYLRTDKEGGVIVDVHVIPNASRTQADGLHDGALRVRLHAPPVDGKANIALITWLALRLNVAKSQISLIRGQTSKRKQLLISSTVCNQANWLALSDHATDKPSTL